SGVGGEAGGHADRAGSGEAWCVPGRGHGVTSGLASKPPSCLRESKRLARLSPVPLQREKPSQRKETEMTLTHQIAELERLAAASGQTSDVRKLWTANVGIAACYVDVYGTPADHEFVTVHTPATTGSFGLVRGTGDTFAEAVADANVRLLIVLAHLDAAAAQPQHRLKSSQTPF